MDLLINKNNIPWYFKLIDWILIVPVYVCIYIAKYRNINFVYYALVCFIIRIDEKLFLHSDLMTYQDEEMRKHLVLGMYSLVLGSGLNAALLSKISKYPITINLLNSIVAIVGIGWRLNLELSLNTIYHLGIFPIVFWNIGLYTLVAAINIDS